MLITNIIDCQKKGQSTKTILFNQSSLTRMFAAFVKDSGVIKMLTCISPENDYDTA